MFDLNDITTIHLEITSKCNALCPQCLRSIDGKSLNPYLPINELSLNDIKKIFSEDFVKQLKVLYMCGSYGDAAAAKDSLEVFRWLRDVNPDIYLSIFSNGGLRSQQFWRDIAGVVNKAYFAIDGLEDTNHIYRKGVQWHKVMENLKAYLDAGGWAQWNYIVFSHNEHQVEEAELFAKQLGVRKFQVKRTGRFAQVPKEKQKIIKPPKNSKYVNPYLDKSSSNSKRDTLDKKIENKHGLVSCKSINEKSLFINADGLVLPCCWLGLELHHPYKEFQNNELWKSIKIDGNKIESLSALKYDLNTIVNNNFFQSTLPSSWNTSPLKRCTMTCGIKEPDFLEGQYE